MNKLLFLCFLTAVNLMAFSGAQAADYVFEARRMEYSGDRPDEKSMEALLGNAAAVKLRTGQVRIKDSERSDFGSPKDYRYVSAYAADLRPLKYETVKTGIFGHVQIVGLRPDSARVDLSISDITPASPAIQESKAGQVLLPRFDSQSMEKGTLELSFGKWFFLPYAAKGQPASVWAFKIEKTGS